MFRNGTVETPSNWDECEFCFKWQHAVKELKFRRQDYLTLKMFTPKEFRKYF